MKMLFANIDPDSWNIKKLQSRGVDARDDLLSLNLAKDEYRGLNLKKQPRRFLSLRGCFN